MTDDRVGIFDASHTFHSSKPTRFEEKDPSGDVVMSESPVSQDLTLLPIPNYSDLVLDCVRQALASGNATPGKIVPVDVAVVCDKSSVKPLIRAVYTRAAAELQKKS